VIYTQHYNKKQVSLSCPKIPPIPKAQKIDLTGIKKVSLKIDVVLKSNKKLSGIITDQKRKIDKIIQEQRKVDRIIQRMDTWGIER